MKTKLKLILLLLVMGLMMVSGVVADANDLVIEGLKINNAVVTNGANTTSLKPLQDLTVEITLKNNNTQSPITEVETSFEINGEDFVLSQEGFFLAASETKKVTLTGKVPLVAEGNYAAEAKASGKDVTNTVIQATPFLLTLVVDQDPADVIISNVTVAPATGVSCASQATLTVELTNRGTSTEDNVDLKVTGGNAFTDTTYSNLQLVSNEQAVRTITIPAEKLATGSNSFTIEVKYRDYYTTTKTVTVQKNACLTGFAPTQTSLLIVDHTTKDFSVTAAETSPVVDWTLQTVGQTTTTPLGTGLSKTLSFPDKGDFVVKAKSGGEEKSWNVKVTDKPLTSNYQIPALSGDLTSVANFYVEKTGVAKIAFTENVNLDNLANLDEAVVISGDKVAVDATKLNGAARITLPKTFTRPLILKATGFNVAPTERCAETDCTQVSNTAGQFAFTVSGFSTYQVVEEVPASLEITSGELLFSNSTRGDNPTVTVTVKNKGAFESLTITGVNTESVNSEYNPRITGLTTPKTLAAGESTTLSLQVKIPEDEAGGKHSIGSLKFVSDKEPAGKLVPIYIQPKSFLAVTTIKVDGSTSGDLLLDEVTKISVTVENQHTKDMKDVHVTVRILDVGDDDDLEEESKTFDLDNGDEETVDFEFDLTKETLDEDSYDVEITVEGEDDDNVDHETVEVKKFNVKRENHHLILKALSLANTQLECNGETTLQVTVENVGKNDEDEVEVRVKNAALNLNLRETDLEVNKFSDSNNDERVSFAIDLADAEAGTYPLTVEVYRDGSLEESKEVTLTVAACGTGTGTGSSGSTTRPSTDQIAQQLQQALVDALSGEQKGPTGATVGATFRDTTAYAVFLVVIGALLLTGVVLSIAVLAKRK